LSTRSRPTEAQKQFDRIETSIPEENMLQFPFKIFLRSDHGFTSKALVRKVKSTKCRNKASLHGDRNSVDDAIM
jgi:hypothetical protein